MKTTLRHLLAATFACLIGASAVAGAAELTSERIIGGTTAPSGKWPYVVALVKAPSSGSNYQDQFCGGTLIAPNFVLTAAHCIYDTDTMTNIAASSVNVLVGTQNLLSGGKRYKVSKIYRHSRYDSDATDYDVAVLKLTSSVPSSVTKPARIIKPTEASTLAKTGTKAYVAGWGNTSKTGESFPSKLLQVQIPILSNATCVNSYDELYGPGTFSPRMLCAGTTNGTKDSCQGDSGGPLFVPSKVGGTTYNVVAGVVSWGEGCAKAGYPGIYSRVAYGAINTWIVQQLAK